MLTRRIRRGPAKSVSLSTFPHEILERVFSYLDVPDLLKVGVVCRRFWAQSNSEWLWKDLLATKFAAVIRKELLVDPAIKSTVHNNRYKEALHTRSNKRILVVDLAFVDPLGAKRTRFPSIQSAIDTAQPGDIIAVRPGLYDEILIISKPLELIGDGPRESVVVKSFSLNETLQGQPFCLLYSAPSGRLVNFTLASFARAKLYIRGGVTIEQCDIKCSVSVGRESNVVVRRSSIHGSEPAGIAFIGGDTHAVLEQNNIHSNYVGVLVSPGDNSQPVVNLLRNKIHGNAKAGIQIRGPARVQVVGNEISENLKRGLKVKDAQLTLRNNSIHHNVLDGVQRKGNAPVDEAGNQIYGNNVGAESGGLLSVLSGLTSDWFEPSKWKSVRAVFLLALFLFSLLQVIWRTYLSPSHAQVFPHIRQR